MAVLARAEKTLVSVVDVTSTTRYYKLQSSTLAKPTKPTANPPTGWTATEPGYTAGATNSLYACDLTVFSDKTWAYSDVSLSSSYEAAKEAYNKAVAAAKTASDYMEYTSAGLDVGNKVSGKWSGFRSRMAAGAFQILATSGTVLASFGAKVIEIGKGASDALIKFCDGHGVIAYYKDTDQLAVMSPSSIAIAAYQVLPDGTLQPYDAGVACNKRGVMAKGVFEVAGSFRSLGREGTITDWFSADGTAGIWIYQKCASGIFTAYAATWLTVRTTSENRASVSMPFTVKSISYTDVGVKDNGWVVDGIYVMSNTETSLQLVYWGSTTSAYDFSAGIYVAGRWK